jgi:hypothetical protein
MSVNQKLLGLNSQTQQIDLRLYRERETRMERLQKIGDLVTQAADLFHSNQYRDATLVFKQISRELDQLFENELKSLPSEGREAYMKITERLVQIVNEIASAEEGKNRGRRKESKLLNTAKLACLTGTIINILI